MAQLECIEAAETRLWIAADALLADFKYASSRCLLIELTEEVAEETRRCPKLTL
ncbi:MAG: hypothetical protein HQ478_07595 [Chloroflexi bacterium]|nr:hypothetical protein [Chloroflexota bacterium]